MRSEQADHHAKHTVEEFRKLPRQRRAELNWTQEVAAEHVQMTTEAYARLERGTSYPSFPTLVLIVHQMGVDPSLVLGFAQDTHSSSSQAELRRHQLLERLARLEPEELRVLDELVLCLTRRTP